jgi:hypothetical protein
VAARIAGVGPSTLRRWRARGLPMRTTRRLPLAVGIRDAAEIRVRALHGQIGAAALAHATPGLSRRSAAGLKAEVLTALERERKAALVRIVISAPGILRGIDAMQMADDEARFALIAGDGAIPYRTSVTSGRCYDTTLVMRALERDLAAAGPPLVYRLDRARCHDAAPVRSLLAAYEVLRLRGPPHHPSYYGQLERQNLEHRAGVDNAPADGVPLGLRLPIMIDCLNRLWPRRSLGWATAADAWSARPPLVVDRQALREEVTDRAARIARTLDVRGQPADLAERLAIEQTLARMGYLRQEIGGWC